MTEAWRIDSLDPRGGLAFASWRPADLTLDSPDLGRAAVFLAPPAFQPEAVQNRTIGFAASRGQAQLGVYVQGAELAFPTLAALTEFVRRVYTAGGAGDLPGGGAGGGRPTPPPLPEDGPEVPRAPSMEFEGEGGAFALVAAAGEARSLSRRMPFFEAGEPVAYWEFDAAAQARTAGSRAPAGWSLPHGAAELALEMVRRFPGSGHTDFAAWAEAAQRLGAAISRLSLWPGVLYGPFGPVFDNVMDVVARSLARAHALPGDRHLISALFGAWGLTGWETSHLDYYAQTYGLQVALGGGVQEGGDPVDDLAAWPLPAEVADLVGLAAPGRSALSLMSTVCGAPEMLAEQDARDVAVRTASILMFCAAHLVSQGAPPPQRNWLLPEAQEAGLEVLAEAARDWLFAQWPAVIYPPPIEELIRSSARRVAA